MNESHDKLILRIIFALIICFVIYIYKYIHSLLYSSMRYQLFHKFFPVRNSSDTIHLFSRIIGIGMIYSNFYFDLSNGMTFAILNFLIESFFVIILYLGSIYIMESIVLYNFEYSDEILKRKNLAYALICFSHSIGVSYVINIIIKVSQGSILFMLFLWLFSMVLIGISSKAFPSISKLSFNRLLVQKNIAIAISYMGFIWGQALIVSASFDNPLVNIKWYSSQILLKIFLALIIIPIFRKGLILIFRIQEDHWDDKEKNRDHITYSDVDIGHGIYEGAIIFTSCFLTTVIMGNINYGNIYPL